MLSAVYPKHTLRAFGLVSGLILGSVTLAWTSPALADKAPLSEALTGEAKADYEAGRVLYTDGDFSGAALKFSQAYKKAQDPRLLWNTAAARKGERRYAEVERLVKQYIQESPGMSAADKAKAEDLLQTISSFIADVSVTVNEAGASILIDEVQVGVSPLAAPLRVDHGKHRIKISKPGFDLFDEVQEFANDTTLAINLMASVQEGRLRVVSPATGEVYVNGKRVTSGTWEGTLASGTHRVEVRSRDRKPYQADVQVRSGESTALQVTLQDLGQAGPPAGGEDSKGSSTWLWITGGVLLLAGVAAGGYFLLKPDPASPPEPTRGTIGTVELGLRY